MNSLQKRGIRFTMNRNPGLTLSDVRFLIKKSNLAVKVRDNFMRELLDSKLSWQKRIEWLMNVVNYAGTKTDSFDYLSVRLNSTEIAQDRFKQKSESKKGSKNPAWKHGGKYSSLSDKFIYAATTDKKEIAKKIAQSNKENGNNDCTLLYWLKQTNGDEEKAKELLSKRQSTFSLDTCIEKHGEVEGKLVWLDRQEKWQKTLNDKPTEEKIEINKKKATKVNYKTLWGKDLDLPGIFYILRVYDNNESFYKVGITTKGVIKRYSGINSLGPYSFEIIKTVVGTINECFKLEQEVIQKNKHMAYKPKIKFAGHTECLSGIPECQSNFPHL